MNENSYIAYNTLELTRISPVILQQQRQLLSKNLLDKVDEFGPSNSTERQALQMARGMLQRKKRMLLEVFRKRSPEYKLITYPYRRR